MRIEILADYACACGEGPTWHPEERAVYWHDIPKGRLFRWDHATGEHAMVLEDRVIGALTIEHDGALLLLRDRGNVVRFARGQVTDTVLESIEGTSRFNDAIADPRGRVYSGTMPVRHHDQTETPGDLYRLTPGTPGTPAPGTLPVNADATSAVTPNCTATMMSRGYGCANGMGFTADGATLYFVDSASHTIWRFAYDQSTGDLRDRRAFLTLPPTAKPDGMTVDAEDHLWVAFWEGSCVRRFSPAGDEVARIDLPTALITSVCFGGPDLDELYITSAGGGDKSKRGPAAGALFRITDLPARGRPEYRSRLT